VWLGQCVGLRNYKFFISFLAWTTLACNFSLYLLLVRLVCAYWLSALTAAPLMPLSTIATLWVLVVAALQCLGTGMSVFLQRMHFALMARNMTTLEMMKAQQVEQQRLSAAAVRSHHADNEANGKSNGGNLEDSGHRSGGGNSTSLASRVSAALQRHLPHWAAHWLPGHSHSHAHAHSQQSYSGSDVAYAPVATADDGGDSASASASASGSVLSGSAELLAEAAADARTFRTNKNLFLHYSSIFGD
jgi:hypothetical protein